MTEDCRLLHGAQTDLLRLKLYAFKRYQDHRRYLDLERRFVARALTGHFFTRASVVADQGTTTTTR